MTALLKNRFSFILIAGLVLAAGAHAQTGFVISYVLQPSGNQTAVANGGTLPFPATNLNSTATASFIVYNGATTPAVLNGVSVTGDAFKVSGLPLLPANLAPGSEVRFTISFTPTARGAATGVLSLDIGTKVSVNLTGQGTGASLAFTATVNGGPAALAPGGTLTLPSTALGATSQADIRVTNSGDANATVSGINVVGAGFKTANMPPLPATLVPGGSLVFSLVFAPTASGAANGTLIIDNATFSLASVGVGSSLVYSSLIGSTSTAIQNGGTIVFPNTNVGSNSSISVLINNTGNTAATIGGIAVSGTGFSLPNLPKLPATLNPGASLQFTVAFAATSTNSVTGTLQIDTFGIGLRANGNPPPALSSVVFANVPATIDPRQQPAITMSIKDPYPIDLSGKLTLAFVSDSFADDPAIQFSTGGRSVNFTIPAGTVDAVFGNSKQVQLQTGTVAGVITATPTFSVAAVDVTPTPAPSAQMTVPATAPQITNVQVGARSANSFELLVTGFSTPRSVTQMTLQFTPAAGSSLQTGNLVVNTDAPFSAWYQSQAGIGYGSQFTASVIVNVAGDVNAVQSVSVTATNSRGESKPVTASLR